MNVEEKYSSDFTDLFSSKKFEGLDYIDRGFAISKIVKLGAILFIGLNPSYTLGANAEFSFYELAVDGNYRYFKKMEEVGKFLNEPWSHFDLLGLRETNQNKIVELLNSAKGLSFVWENLLLSKQIIEETKPKLIIVTNTLARVFLGKDVDKKGNGNWLGYNFTFDSTIGTDRVANENSNLFNTPVFFTSMLTGQRALDKGSLERLKWHISKVLLSL